MITIHDSGCRKDGTAPVHVGRQWLGKTDYGIVTVTTLWTVGRVYHPLHATPCTPAHHFTRGRIRARCAGRRRWVGGAVQGETVWERHCEVWGKHAARRAW
ncbi:hypothetical protein ABT275_32190 [Streptomyces sp. NPDC001185]|uniref:hypothetical protein n=1 Tax=Streptomyces sp. NPDC001185 TaxID=3154380 RepID=UPI0033313160